MAEPVPMRMSDQAALKLLREIAGDSASVIFTKHAREPVALDQHGNWKLTVTHRVAGVELHVAVAIDVPVRAIVITVFHS